MPSTGDPFLDIELGHEIHKFHFASVKPFIHQRKGCIFHSLIERVEKKVISQLIQIKPSKRTYGFYMKVYERQKYYNIVHVGITEVGPVCWECTDVGLNLTETPFMGSLPH